MIGIDLTKVSRFEGKELQFAKRILTEKEFGFFELSNNKTKFIATRWAIKEALFKADNSLRNYPHMEIEKNLGRYEFEGFEISTSDEDDLVIAIVINKER